MSGTSYPTRLVSLSLLLCVSFGSSQPLLPNTPFVRGGRSVDELVEWEVVTPQWLKSDTFKVSNKSSVRKELRYPPDERRYSFTRSNQYPVLLSSESQQYIPSAAKLLQSKKAPTQLYELINYQPLLTIGTNARHRFAEGLHIRWRHIGATDECLVALLYMPIGWPMVLLFVFFISVLLVPIVGAFLVHAGFKICRIFRHIMLPLKMFLRWMYIQEQLSILRWQKRIAPPHFLEPRTSWKLPFFLRHDNLEDIPCELAYKPPINKIDYTMYILTEEDYDEMDLGMDEMEYIDDLLQFRDSNPKAVARLLKYKLGEEKFYYYFDEDILSDESDDVGDEPPPPKPEEVAAAAAAAEGDEPKSQYEYLKLLEVDEPWMHDEYDAKFTGPPFQLEEIRKRRMIVKQLKEEIGYLHNLIVTDNMFEKNYAGNTDAERRKAIQKANKIMDKFVRFSNMTKERIAEIEPSAQTQAAHNPALSKYLPLVDQMSHYNHRLNLKHEKQKDPAKRKVQLDIFGGP